jgi:apolipoprotein N-acyltransferase
MLQKVLNSRIYLVFIIPFLLGLISVLSFQPFNFPLINFIIFPIIFLLLTYINKKSKNKYRKKPYLKNLFFVGYFFGIGFFLSGTHWISYSLTFDETFKYFIPLSIILIPLFLAIFFGVATILIGPFLQNNFYSILLFCFSFASLDYVRSKILTGFPWNLWAYSWSSFTEVLQILSIIGLFAFNILTITIFCIPLLLFFKNKKVNLSIFTFWVVLFLSNYIYGSIKVNKNYKEIKSSDKEEINIKIISPNFDLKYNLTNSDIRNLLSKLIRYSQPDKEKETLFVWPEGVFTGYNLSDISEFKSLIKNNFSTKHKIMFGVNTYDHQRNKYFNSLILINNKFEIIYSYNKKKLVPFGEFLPIESIIKKIGLKKITHGYESFSKGKNQKNLILGNLNILPLICYEVIFTELIQKAENKTNLIVNISEDAWFGDSIGPKQNFTKAIYRAIESGTFLVRSANKGYSAFINNRGEVLKSLKPNEAGNIEMNIPIVSNSFKNKNDLIFFILLFTYTLIFFTLKKISNEKK